MQLMRVAMYRRTVVPKQFKMFSWSNFFLHLAALKFAYLAQGIPYMNNPIFERYPTHQNEFNIHEQTPLASLQ